MRRGSSPRMRGALGVVRDGTALGGIIPADAGSTVMLPSESYCNGDHPRGCGEHPSSHHAQHFVAGSSPRMRGAPRIG